MKQFTLSKKERLKSRKRIEHLFKAGRSLSKFPFKVVYYVAQQDVQTDGLAAGFSASSRNFKRAVDRNRIKRLMREAYRLQKTPLKELLATQQRTLDIFFIYTGKELPDHSLVSTKMQGLLNLLIQTLSHETTP